MKATKKKKNRAEISPEEALRQVRKIFKERGSKALEIARKEVLKEKIECKEAQEALTYFITKCWHDLARPTLLSLACEAVGGNIELTTPIAVPMILISGAIDIHDDIIDESKIKDGRPTVYGKFGKEIALLAGDALLFKGFTLLQDAIREGVPAQKLSIINDIIKQSFFELGDAEALELSFRRRMGISLEEYLDVVRKKAADVEAHTRISAILGGGTVDEVEALGKYGRLLGMIKILRDEAVDMVDTEEFLHRLKKEHLPVPLLYALRNPKISPKIRSILLKKTLTKKEVQTILRLTYSCGGFRDLEELMQKLAEKAFDKLYGIKNSEKLFLLLQSLLMPFNEC